LSVNCVQNRPKTAESARLFLLISLAVVRKNSLRRFLSSM